MPTYSRDRKRRMRNPRQLIWSFVILALAFAALWWQENNRIVPQRTTVLDTTTFIAERFPGRASIHVLLGIPTDNSPNDDVLIQRWQYVLSYNPSTQCANWVSWNQSAWWYGKAPRHRGQFMPDPLLPRLYPPVLHRDYTNSGFDRGHLVRSEERTRTVEDNLTTFYTTNIIPQYHQLNAGPWLELEDYVEQLCKQQQRELFIIAGPIFHANDYRTIGRGVRVPSECFKIIVLLPKGHGPESVTLTTPVIAVRMPNVPTVTGPWQRYITTVADIEHATGYQFFTALPDSITRSLKLKRGGALSF